MIDNAVKTYITAINDWREAYILGDGSINFSLHMGAGKDLAKLMSTLCDYSTATINTEKHAVSKIFMMYRSLYAAEEVYRENRMWSASRPYEFFTTLDVFNWMGLCCQAQNMKEKNLVLDDPAAPIKISAPMFYCANELLERFEP